MPIGFGQCVFVLIPKIISHNFILFPRRKGNFRVNFSNFFCQTISKKVTSANRAITFDLPDFIKFTAVEDQPIS